MDHSAALLRQTELFGELLRDADLSSPVPTCPGWTLQQLFRHLGRGHRWAAQIISDRMSSPLDPKAVRDGKPPSDLEGALAWLNDSARVVLEAVKETGPDTPVWTFLGPRPAVWWIRRRLHEATVHRADAALALGVPYELPAELAADGISEWLDLLAAGPANRDPAPLEPGTTLHLRATEDSLGTGGEWLIQTNEGKLSWEHGAQNDATVSIQGQARDLLLAILRRRTIDELQVQVLGDQDVWTTWLERTPF